MTDFEKLAHITLAPYIQKATALIGHERRVGGNQFRHAMATLAILIDYKIIDPVLLKASVIHDLIEDEPGTNLEELKHLDSDGELVLQLVKEVTKRDEPKAEYLKRIKDTGSHRAKVLKIADRISNLTDLNKDIFDEAYIRKYLKETHAYVYPMAIEVNPNMAIELRDLINKRKELIEAFKQEANT